MNKIASVFRWLLAFACLMPFGVHAQVVPFFIDYAATNYTMGSQPAGLRLANLRGKSTYRDLVVANSGGNTVGVRLCEDNGTFGTLVTYPVGTTPMGVMNGDFNRDGYDDVAVANFGSGTVSILLNQQTGLLGVASDYPVGSTMDPGPIAVSTGDVNGDGRLDLIVANYNEGTVSVLIGQGGGVFSSPANYAVGANPRSVWVGDLNGDGKLDILTANSGDGSISILYGAGDGTFPTGTNYSILPYLPYYATVDDFNNDGIPDIVTANYNSNNISIYLGQTNRTFQFWTNYPVGSQPVYVLPRVLNNDANIDLAVANSGSDDISILLGLGNGSFVSNGTNYPVGAQPVVVEGSHFNNDNVTDLAVANSGTGSTGVTLLIHDLPISYNATVTAVENKPLTINLSGAVYPGRPISYIVLTNTVANGTLVTNGPSPSVIFTSATNFSGTASFNYEVSDGITDSPPGTVTVNVLVVNHAPSFTLQTNAVTALENATLQSYANFATNLSTGPPNESGQTLSFVLTNDNPALFITAPAISSTGTLTFQPRAKTSGTATVSARLTDNGGTANGGTNASGPTAFIIFVPPILNHTNLVGTTNTFSIGAAEPSPLVKYNWQSSPDGITYTPIANATNASFAITNIVAANEGYYSVTASNSGFGLAFTASGFLTVSNDIIRPTVSIVAPASLQRISNNVFTATGTASDNVQVTNVSYSLNGASYVSAITTNQWKNWSAVLNGHLSAGTNILNVQSVDFSGNASLPSTANTRTFFYVVDSTITILTNGVGTVSTNVNGHQLEVGRGYTIKAIPGAGQVFNSWNGSDGTFSTMIVFSPWAFGTTQAWSVWVMNALGYALGVLLGIKLWIHRVSGYRPARWGESRNGDPAQPEQNARHLMFVTRALAILTLLILGYCLVNVLNARSTYYPAERNFDYHDFISWLPHSYDRNSSLQAFWNYLALALSFWALCGWLPGKSAAEERVDRVRVDDAHGHRAPLLPDRLRRLLWVLTINGGLLGLEGIVQRLHGEGKLLFLVQARVNRDAESQFGPYAYRSNATQYFNLLWPVCLGFWWSMQRSLSHNSQRARLELAPRHWALICALTMAACPLIATSRAGAIVDLINLAAAGAILWFAQKKGDHKAKARIVLVTSLVLGIGLLLGWKSLAPRFESASMSDSMDIRNRMYELARPMVNEYAPYGTGPGTFDPVFQIERNDPNEYWPAQLHNDWLETLITFGYPGAALIAAAFCVLLARWFIPGGIRGGRRFAMFAWVALAGCMMHARYDFPFQVYSIVFLFLMVCAMLFSMSYRSSS